MPLTASIRGSGVAVRCVARLLEMQGLPWTIAATARGRGPAVLLSDQALALMRDVLGEPQMLTRQRRIHRRVVTWGGQPPVSVDHGAVVLAEGELDEVLAIDGEAPASATHELTIHAAAPFPGSDLHMFGSRRAMAAEVTLLREEDFDACWVEAVESGWLFMIPTRGGAGWLLAVGGDCEEMLAQSSSLAARIRVTHLSAGAFETAPRMIERLAGPGWLACGTEAIAFDPICGDGTAQAVREAVLAAALAHALAQGEDPEALATHYHSILLAAMRRHLRLCAQFYASGGSGPWWRAQQAALADGFEWCTARLAQQPEPRFELRGMALARRELAS
jgi:hypothetical protein